jgi:hypothetical protein
MTKRSRDGEIDGLGGDLAELSGMSLEELRALWPARFRDPVPKLRSRDLTARAMTYRLQAAVFGGLSIETERRLADLARRFAADRGFTPVSGPALKPGSSLVREWRGVRHEVRVAEAGFVYRGQPYRSLSSVARQITGTRWNGQAFFGLRKSAKAAELAA